MARYLSYCQCGANGCFHGADILYIDLSAHREATRVSRYSAGKPHHTDICLGFKDRHKHTHMHSHARSRRRETQPHFGGVSSHVVSLLLLLSSTVALDGKPTNKNRAAMGARAGCVRLNPPTARRDQRRKNIACSCKRLASIIHQMHRCFLQISSSSPRYRSCPSLAAVLPQLQGCHKLHFGLFFPTVYPTVTLGWLFYEEIGYNLSDTKKKMQRRNLPAETYTFPTPSALIFPTCTCQERCSCHLALFIPSPSDPLFLRGPSINVKMRQNVAILYLHPHSILIPSLYPQPFPQQHLFNSPHHFSPQLGLSPCLATHPLLLSS